MITIIKYLFQIIDLRTEKPNLFFANFYMIFKFIVELAYPFVSFI